MSRVLVWAGVVLLAAAAGLLWWIDGQRADDQAACTITRLEDPAAGCNLMPWWPAIVVAAAGVIVLVVGARARNRDGI